MCPQLVGNVLIRHKEAYTFNPAPDGPCSLQAGSSVSVSKVKAQSMVFRTLLDSAVKRQTT